MSVKSGQAITVLFSTANASTGAAADASSTPTGTLYVNGTANGATVTVTNITTGLYKAALTLPSLTAGDVVSLRVTATVATVAGEGVVWQDVADTVRLSDVPAVNVTTWAGVATTSNERDAMNRLYDMIGTGLGQRYFNSMALQQVKNSIGLAAANLDTQLSTIDGIVDALALVAPDNQPIVNADGETLAYMTALSEEEIAAAVIVALQETPVEVICVTPQPSQESDYDILRNNATNC